MRGKIVAVALAAIGFAAPALAADVAPPPKGNILYSSAPMVVGHVEMGLGFVSGNLIGPGGTLGAFTGAGRANKVLGGGWNLELEAGGVAAFNNTGAANLFGGYGHLWTMHSAADAVGVFGGAAFGGTVIGTVGVEAKHNFGPMNLGGMVAGLLNSGTTLWAGAVNANMYLDPNTRVGAKATFASGVWDVGADVEHRFPHPISVWGSLNYASVSGGGSTNAWAGLVGLRVFADGPNSTLRSHDDTVPWHFSNPLRTY